MVARGAALAATVVSPDGLSLPSRSGDGVAQFRAEPQTGAAGTEPAELRPLLLAIRRGDEQAFARFYERFSFRLYKFLLVLARGDEPTAGEVCQAVFIKLAKRVQVFDDERQLWAWLCTLARNAFIDHCRARRRRSWLVFTDAAPPELAPEPLPAHRLSDSLHDALAGLAPEERELIHAAYVDERPLQELADESGQTYKAVESRLARLRQKLKTRLLKELRHESEP